MKFLKNISLMLLVNIAIVVTISIVLHFLGLDQYVSRQWGGNFGGLMAYYFVWGMAGAFISLWMSRGIAKMYLRHRGFRLVDANSSQPQERRVYEIVRRAAERAGLPKTPEAGIYESPEMNAFATGPSRSSSLVVVTSGLLSSMKEDELEGVIGHEVAHIANGDMVTMTLLQGVVNSLVMFAAHIVSMLLSNAIEERSRPWVRFLVMIVAQIAFGFLGVLVTSAFSRRREFRADAGGAQLMGRDKMISALQALRDRQRVIDTSQPELANFKIFGKTSGWMGLVMSHPPLDKRIEALRSGVYR